MGPLDNPPNHKPSVLSQTCWGPSSHKYLTGQPITLFYADRLGYYPNINESTGVHKNCGLPQVGSLKKHLDKAEKDIAYYMPIDNVGLAVIDWENWRPTWERNWKPKDVYKKESIELVLQQNYTLLWKRLPRERKRILKRQQRASCKTL